MDLFVRESGAVGAPAIVFLHGGEYSGRSWQPVVDRLQRYHCLVPDLPQHGRSIRHRPFEMVGAAAAVAELIYARVGAGRVHVVGFSLGAQVGVQLLATAPELVDRAVLCGTLVDVMPVHRRRSNCWSCSPGCHGRCGLASGGMRATSGSSRRSSPITALICV